ncbi:MAG: hypothetical protein K2Y37_14760 [Pirellulales bacterium]|nr:hypothetical protein [Pirellulales bacterium]
MSWSFTAVGRPELIAAALEAESAKLTGQCKVEFDAAWPHLAALLRENFALADSGYYPPLIEFYANGSGTSKEGRQLQRNCTVTIKPLSTSRILLDPPPA